MICKFPLDLYRG